MITYVWQFDSLDVIPTYQSVTNAVESMHWRITADDGLGHHATAYGETKTGQVDVNNFIEFSHLSPSVVQGWCEAQMGSELGEIQAHLVGLIGQQVNPNPVSMTPPWLYVGE